MVWLVVRLYRPGIWPARPA